MVAQVALENGLHLRWRARQQEEGRLFAPHSDAGCPAGWVEHDLGPLRHRGHRDQGRCDHGEHGLEDHVCLVRHRRAVVGIRSESDAVQAPPGKAAEHAAADIWTERQAVAPQRPLHADDADNDEALHDGGQGVFAADQPAVEERQARGHQQDQG